MKKNLVLHPLLFALFPVLFLYFYNFGQILQNEIYLSLALIVLAAVLLWLLFGVFLRNIRKAGILTSLFLVLFFSYGHFFKGPKVEHAYFLTIWGVIFALIAYCIIRSRSNLFNLTIILNAVAIFLVTMQVIVITFSAINSRKQNKIPVKQAEDFNLGAPSALPDIYYIILDGYARQDVLKEFYQYDNSGFLDYLSKKGFFVANKSTSNYCQTTLSLASSLNFNYLDELAKGDLEESDNRLPLSERIEKSEVFRLLRKQGYRIIVFASGYNLTEVRSADVYLYPFWSLRQFQNELLNTTFIPYLIGCMRLEIPQRSLHRNWILHVFEGLANPPKLKGPILVFAHILAPHPPFVFERNGSQVRDNRPFSISDGSTLIKEGINREKYVSRYINQLIFINTKVKETLERILARTGRKQIIILQADHGPGSMLDWGDVAKTNLRERMSIFNAYYFSDKGHYGLYETISPVNTFRVIFNRYFNANLEILPDRAYFSTWNRPYQFIDVTEKVHERIKDNE